MRSPTKAVWTAAILTVVGAGCFGVRLAARGQAPAAVPGEAAYLLRYRAAFVADRAGAGASLAIPAAGARCRIEREAFNYSSGVDMDVRRTGDDGQRRVVVTALGGSAEPVRFTAEFDLRVSAAGQAALPGADPAVSDAERAGHLRPETLLDAGGAEAAGVLAAMSKDAPPPPRLLARIFDHVSARIAEVRQGPFLPADVLRGGKGTPLGKARAMVALCQAASIPARLVRGFDLHAPGDDPSRVWVEACPERAWVPHDPSAGLAGTLPPHYLPVARGQEFIRDSSFPSLSVRFSVQRLPAGVPPPPATRSLADIFNFSRLPAGMQDTVAVLLLLPAAALITAVLRNVVGLQTFGTFTPGLLALSFLYADWRTGLVILAGVLTIGVAGRSLLNRLRLLMIPRLSVLLAMLVIFTAFAVSALGYFGVSPSDWAVLLPMVILTLLVERFYVTCEEDGLRQSAKQLLLTLVVAGCCLLVLRWKQLGRLALAYPEGELLVVAGLMLLGRYSGYRLVELVRFRDVTRAAT